MERGLEWEEEAVSERWTELERRERAARRLHTGVLLALCGLALALAGLPTEACVEQGAWPHGCTAVVPRATRTVLLAVGPAAAIAGLWRCWRAFDG